MAQAEQAGRQAENAIGASQEAALAPIVGMVFAGDARDQRLWSGIPAALAEAMGTLGCKVIHVTADLPPVLAGSLINAAAVFRVARFGLSRPSVALRRARWQARAAPSLAGVRRRLANRALRRLDFRLEALLQIHAEYPIAGDTRLATYEDLTVVQAVRHGYAEFERMGAAEVERRVELQREAYLRADVCCTTSRWAAASIIADYGIPAERVVVVGIGSNRAGATVERSWQVPRFLFVGRDWRRKNGDAVLRAFLEVRAAMPAAELHLVGEVPSITADGVTVYGPLRLDLVEERAVVDDLFRRATCFVMPSQVEPSAIAYVEAGAFGLPSIGTTVGGSADLIGGGGKMVDPDDHDGLVAAMLELCDPERAALLGRAAACQAQLYTWPAVASRILAALEVAGFEDIPRLWDRT